MSDDVDESPVNKEFERVLKGKTIDTVWDSPDGGIALVFTDGVLADLRVQGSELLMQFFHRNPTPE